MTIGIRMTYAVLMAVAVGGLMVCQMAGCTGNRLVADLNQPCGASETCEAPAECLTLPGAAVPSCEISCTAETNCPDGVVDGEVVPSSCRPIACREEEHPDGCPTYCMRDKEPTIWVDW